MDKKKLQKLLEVHHQHILFNGCTLGDSKLLPDQTQSKPTFALTDLALDSIALPLIIQKLALLSANNS